MGLAVKAEMCATCIFRPGNPMRLKPGRVASMVRECDRQDSHIICHDTIDHELREDWPDAPMSESEAVCRGYYDTGRRSQLLRIAERINAIEEV